MSTSFRFIVVSLFCSDDEDSVRVSTATGAGMGSLRDRGQSRGNRAPYAAKHCPRVRMDLEESSVQVHPVSQSTVKTLDMG